MQQVASDPTTPRTAIAHPRRGGISEDPEKEYKESGADNPDLSREELIALMVRYPKLIERPIVVSDSKAAIGRPPEQVLDIL